MQNFQHHNTVTNIISMDIDKLQSEKVSTEKNPIDKLNFN